jgi:hypothetical protein
MQAGFISDPDRKKPPAVQVALSEGAENLPVSSNAR